MHSSLLTIALLSVSGAVAANEKRQATDAAQFTSAANELISKYIPSTALVPLEAAIMSAASAAGVTGDAQSLLYSGLADASAPGWFASAIPSAYSSQIAALGSDISSLRGTTGAGATAGAGAGAGGSGTATKTTTTTSTASGSGSAGMTGTGSSVVSKASGAGSTGVSGASSVGSAGVSKVSSAGSAGVSGASSAGSAGVSGATSVVSKATSAAGGAMPTAVKGAAAGVAGIIGLMAAL